MDNLNGKANGHVKVLIPGPLQSERLYLSDGRVFSVAIEDGIFFKKKVLREDNEFWEGIDDQTLEAILNADTLKTEGNLSLDDFVSSGTSALDPLIKAALQELRRRLIESSSGQLKLIFQDFFDKNKKHIAEVFTAPKSDGVITSVGLMPKLARFRWIMKKGDTRFSIYCLELSPHRRHIVIKNYSSGSSSHRYNWAMPWLCILAIFKDDNFLELTAFYRDKPLDAEDNSLMKCGLPGKYNEAPWTYCDNQSAPSIKLSDSKWVDKLLIWFFDSTFIYHDNLSSYDDEFEDILKSVPEFKSFPDWESLSNDSAALQKVCKVRFPSAPMNLQQYVVKIMEYLAGKKVKESPEAVKKKEFAVLAERFEQMAREKFVFLVGKTAVNVDVKDKAKTLIIEALNALKTKLQRDLGGKITGLGMLIKQSMANKIEPHKGDEV